MASPTMNMLFKRGRRLRLGVLVFHAIVPDAGGAVVNEMCVSSQSTTRHSNE
jgi:hypothetical protein